MLVGTHYSFNGLSTTRHIAYNTRLDGKTTGFKYSRKTQAKNTGVASTVVQCSRRERRVAGKRTSPAASSSSRHMTSRSNDADAAAATSRQQPTPTTKAASTLLSLVMTSLTQPASSWFTFLFFLVPALLNLADGCYRRSARPLTTPPPETDMEPAYPDVPQSHKQECFEDETLETRCLHGGSCFAVEVVDPISEQMIRSVGCQCPSEFVGSRCQYQAIDPDLLALREQQARTAHIAAGVSICILVVFVVLFGVYVFIRNRRQRPRQAIAISDNERSGDGKDAENIPDEERRLGPGASSRDSTSIEMEQRTPLKHSPPQQQQQQHPQYKQQHRAVDTDNYPRS